MEVILVYAINIWMSTSNKPSNRGVNMRLILYIVIAMLTTMINEFNSIPIEDIANMHIMHWFTKFASVTMPGLVAWRAFLDQSITDLNENNTIRRGSNNK